MQGDAWARQKACNAQQREGKSYCEIQQREGKSYCEILKFRHNDTKII